MRYRFRRREAVDAGVRRIAREQIDRALDELRNPAVDVHETIHQVRKRCKKIRGLVRLVRPSLRETYARENAWFRDLARGVSHLRDAGAAVEACRKLEAVTDDGDDRQALQAVRDALNDRRRCVVQASRETPCELEALAARFAEARQRVDAWTLDASEFDAIRTGLKRTYARARRGLAQAARKGGTRTLHEWRKRVKYHWYHTRLLRNAWKPVMAQRRDALETLGERLGDDHDLAGLRAWLVESNQSSPRDAGTQRVLELVDQRRAALQRDVERCGELLFAEKPKCHVHRIGAYWRLWRP